MRKILTYFLSFAAGVFSCGGSAVALTCPAGYMLVNQQNLYGAESHGHYGNTIVNSAGQVLLQAREDCNARLYEPHTGAPNCPTFVSQSCQAKFDQAVSQAMAICRMFTNSIDFMGNPFSDCSATNYGYKLETNLYRCGFTAYRSADYICCVPMPNR